MTTTLEISEKIYSVAEWLELEKHSEIRHEFYYGKLIPMAGEAKRANKIAKNILKLIDDPLIEKRFEVFSHDVKAEVVPNGIYRYPDLVVAPDVDDEDDYIVKHPVMMVEVASKDSKTRDRIKKRKEYLEIPSMWYYLIIDQDEMLAELHVRNENGQWARGLHLTEASDLIDLPKFNIKFELGEIYKRVKLT